MTQKNGAAQDAERDHKPKRLQDGQGGAGQEAERDQEPRNPHKGIKATRGKLENPGSIKTTKVYSPNKANYRSHN